LSDIDEVEEPEDLGVDVTLMAAWTDPAAITLLEQALPNTSHLKPLWERIRVHIVDGRACVGLPIASKVNDETCDNHARHLYSLLNLLGVPLATSPMALIQVVVNSKQLRPLHYVDPRVEKEKEKARLKALAAEAAAAAAEAAAEAAAPIVS